MRLTQKRSTAPTSGTIAKLRIQGNPILINLVSTASNEGHLPTAFDGRSPPRTYCTGCSALSSLPLKLATTALSLVRFRNDGRDDTDTSRCGCVLTFVTNNCDEKPDTPMSPMVINIHVAATPAMDVLNRRDILNEDGLMLNSNVTCQRHVSRDWQPSKG